MTRHRRPAVVDARWGRVVSVRALRVESRGDSSRRSGRSHRQGAHTGRGDVRPLRQVLNPFWWARRRARQRRRERRALEKQAAQDHRLRSHDEATTQGQTPDKSTLAELRERRKREALEAKERRSAEHERERAEKARQKTERVRERGAGPPT